MTSSPTGRNRKDTDRYLIHNYYTHAAWYARQTHPIARPIVEIDFTDVETRLIQLLGDDDPYFRELKRRLETRSRYDPPIPPDEAIPPDDSGERPRVL